MNLKRSAFFVILLAVVCIGLQSCAKKTTPANAVPEAKKTTPANAAPEVKNTTSANAAPVFVPMPDDIKCKMFGVNYSTVITADGSKASTTFSLVKKVTCHKTAESNFTKVSRNVYIRHLVTQEKEIPLASTKVTDGMLPTIDFGELELTCKTENQPDLGVRIAIRRDKLQSFRDYLQK
jgi:hypothetical protein